MDFSLTLGVRWKEMRRLSALEIPFCDPAWVKEALHCV